MTAAGNLAEVTTIYWHKATPCPTWCLGGHEPSESHGKMITGKDSGAYVWLDDCGKDGQINVNFRWDNDLAELRDRSVMTVDQAEERGRALLAAVRVARPRNGVPAKSRRR